MRQGLALGQPGAGGSELSRQGHRIREGANTTNPHAVYPVRYTLTCSSLSLHPKTVASQSLDVDHKVESVSDAGLTHRLVSGHCAGTGIMEGGTQTPCGRDHRN